MGIEGLLQAHIVAPWAAVGTLPRTGEPKYISQYEHAYKFSKLCILLYRSCFVIVTVLQYFKWLGVKSPSTVEKAKVHVQMS